MNIIQKITAASTVAINAPSVVRIAGPDDAQEVWRMFLQLHKENGIFSLAPEKVQFFMNRALMSDQIPDGDTGARGVIGVIGSVGNLEALVFVTVSQYWYSHDYHIEEYCAYVDPEHRRSGHAQALIQWMKHQVEITGLPLMTGIISNVRTEAKCRLYRRMLPKAGEFFFVTPKGSTIATSKSS